MQRIYLDTSLYLGILLGEAKAKPFQKTILGKTLCSSTLLLIEAERNLVRLSRDRLLAPDLFVGALERLKKDKELFLLRDLTVDFCLTGAFPPVRVPRSSDLIHLRTAMWFQQTGGLELFLTLDDQQYKAAQEFGLPTSS
ncbi:MAG: hypothetical protein HY465_05325 [Deltaproteobacteria bacterium]|nr:hypothetical protein [Deltaproteobacteria bacterium]